MKILLLIYIQGEIIGSRIISILVLSISISFSTKIYCQLPRAPIIVDYELNYKGSDYELDLRWQSEGDYELTDFFNIYLTSGNTEFLEDFSLSSTITRDGDELTI